MYRSGGCWNTPPPSPHRRFRAHLSLERRQTAPVASTCHGGSCGHAAPSLRGMTRSAAGRVSRARRTGTATRTSRCPHHRRRWGRRQPRGWRCSFSDLFVVRRAVVSASASSQSGCRPSPLGAGEVHGTAHDRYGLPWPAATQAVQHDVGGFQPALDASGADAGELGQAPRC